MRQISAVLIGAGARGNIYAGYSLSCPEELRITAVAEPDKDRREKAALRYHIPQDCCFEDYRELFDRPRLGDAALICTLDADHTIPAVAALQKGYHVLLEKPMSNSREECIRIAEAARAHDRVLSVCHVLRYTPFYRKIRELLKQGAVGELAAMTQIENVAWWHQAHSFVRGSWRNEEETSPMILQKSCHDLDILMWLADRPCKRLSSYGSLRHFRPENAPEGAPRRCLEGCPHAQECIYHAGKIYLTDYIKWPVDMISQDMSYEGRRQALLTGPYGRCVYRCDNDVVDRQSVMMEFEGGLVVNFLMTAFTEDSARQLKIMGTEGQLQADMGRNRIVLHRFGEKPVEYIPSVVEDAGGYGHGGGDYFLMRDFLRLAAGEDAVNLSGAEASLQSHLMCFAAEKSRKEGIGVDMEEYGCGRSQDSAI